MRLITYGGLVARRLWAKRGILSGSFLGATLVTALLVIVPLYESSVQSVDLLFSLRGATTQDVDITVSAQTTDYDGDAAEANRRLVDELWRARVAEWYPTTLERSQSREFAVVPIHLGVDWVGDAEAWQEDRRSAVEAGVSDEELPPAPYPQTPPEATQVRLFTGPDIFDRLVVLDGELVPASPDPGYNTPLRIAIGSDLATRIQRGVGDRFVLKPFTGGQTQFEVVEVTAIVDAADDTDVIWGIDSPGSMVYLSQDDFDTWLGSVPVADGDDPWLRAERGFPGLTVNQRITLRFDPGSVELAEMPALAGSVEGFRADVARDSGGTVAATTFIGNLLQAFTTRSVTIGAPILAVLALVLGGALYFLVYTAALTLEREGPEMALLKTRGASSWQTIGIHLAQSFAIAAVAALVAPVVARTLVALTGRVPPLSDLTGGEPLSVAQVRSITPFVLAGAGVTFAAMGLAILPFARRSVLELRSLAARPGRSSVWQRYNLDLFAIAISLVVLFQMSQRGFINTTAGEVRLDPLAIIFPALLLLTGALLLLRLLPWVLRLAGWVMTKARSMSAALPGWHLGRNPVPYGRLALLVWLTTGLGAFALTYANTLDGSFTDRAAFVAGSDVRVVAEGAGLLPAPEGTTATPVLRTSGAPRQTSRQAEVLAVDPEGFADVVRWRSDFGPPPEVVFGALRPDGTPPDVGVELPARATAVLVDGVVIPLSLADRTELAERAPDQSLRLMIKVIDGEGRVWTMEADRDFVDTEWRTMAIDLSTGLDERYPTPPSPPLSIHTMWVERTSLTGGTLANGEQVLFADFRIATPQGESPIGDSLEELETTNGLGLFGDALASEALDSYYSELPEGETAPTPEEIAASPLDRDGVAVRWVLPMSRTRSSPDVPALRTRLDPFQVLLDERVAGSAGLDVGDQ